MVPACAHKRRNEITESVKFFFPLKSWPGKRMKKCARASNDVAYLLGNVEAEKEKRDISARLRCTYQIKVTGDDA